MQDMPEMTPEENGWSNILEEIDLDTSLAESIENPEWLNPPEIDAAELERLDDLVPDIVQDLADRDLLPDMPEMDMDLSRDELVLEHDYDLDR